jgi:nucleotide-binding universal stress UspA family protein
MIKTIVVATDASKHGKKAVKLSSELARSLKARLVIVHSLLFDATGSSLRKIVSRQGLTREQRQLLDNYEIDTQMTLAAAGGLDSSMAFVPAPIELLEPVGRQILEQAALAARQGGVKNVTTKLMSGSPPDSILAAAKKEKADLVVLGTRGYGELKGLFLGSVSHKVSAQADCPVLTVK